MEGWRVRVEGWGVEGGGFDLGLLADDVILHIRPRQLDSFHKIPSGGVDGED